MLDFFHKPRPANTNTSYLSIQLSGLHCGSCALNIDTTLEDILGVSKSTTNYARQHTLVSYDCSKVTPSTIVNSIQKLGYHVISSKPVIQ